MLWFNFVSSLKGFKAFENTVFHKSQDYGSRIQADSFPKNVKRNGNIHVEVLCKLKYFSIHINAIDPNKKFIVY